MRDTTDQGREPEEEDDPIPMTLLAISGAFWLFEGEALLNDLLYGTGAYPFQVRCVHFKDAFELKRFFGDDFVVSKLWRINPDIIDRLRREHLLVEITPDGG
jgi:hypothetical protein